MRKFKSLEINNWRQFSKVKIDFHKQLTILTGANGAGKTTILNILNRHFGWNVQILAIPHRDEEKGVLSFLTGFWDVVVGQKPANQSLGKIEYADGSTAQINAPVAQGSIQYQLQISGMKEAPGIHIPSHRPIYSYQSVTQIPTAIPSRHSIFENHRGHTMGLFNGSFSGRTANSLIKETLISLALFGEGNKHVTPNTEAQQTFQGFQSILKQVLPDELGFEKIQIVSPEVVLHTKTGNFSLDAVSGGVAAIIDLAWQIFLKCNDGLEYIITIDEPENHLHPKLQRTVLPRFIKAFPNVQFIVVTHNPFIVTSVPDSNVYVLDYDENKKVFSKNLDIVNRAGDSNEILRDVLGLPTASPVWVEDRLSDIVARYSKVQMSEEQLANLRNEMAQLGLDKVFPKTLSEIRKN